MVKIKNIVVFASGNGSNFIAIHKSIEDGKINGRIVLLISNNPHSKAIDFARLNNIKTSIINKDIISDLVRHKDFLLKELESVNTDLIVLAGYLKMIPINIISEYKNKILNIHPSLLPKFGGKGFYGMKVHEAVFKSKEVFTGATVHFVDEIYDNGPILSQKKIKIFHDDNPETIAKKVLDIEHRLLPYIVQKFCLDKIVFKNKKPIVIGE